VEKEPVKIKKHIIKKKKSKAELENLEGKMGEGVKYFF